MATIAHRGVAGEAEARSGEEIDRPVPPPVDLETGRMILVTAHRRESFGAPLAEVFQALRDLVQRDSGLSVVFPVPGRPASTTSIGAPMRMTLVAPA